MPKPRRPGPFGVGHYRLAVVRGPHKDDRTLWYWRASEYRASTRNTVWTGWATRDDATSAVAALIVHGEAPADDRCDTVEDLLLYWLAAQEDRPDLKDRSKQTMRAATKQLVHALGKIRVEHIRQADLEGYRDRRMRPSVEPPPPRKKGQLGRLPSWGNASPHTVERELRFLRYAWKWGYGLGLLQAEELPRVRIRLRETRDRHTPSRAEVAQVCHCLDGWPWLVVRLLYATGARLGEIASLRRGDISCGRSEIAVDGKTGPRIVPVHPKVMAELAPHVPDGPADRRIWRVTEGTIESSLTRYLDPVTAELGQRRWTAQDLRRAAVDEMYRSGADPATVAMILGHTVTTAMKHYRRPTEEDRRAAVARGRIGVLEAAGGEVVNGPWRP